MKLALMAAAILAVSPGMLGQSRPGNTRAPARDRDQLGMSCAQILGMSSTEWIEEFKQKANADSGEQATVRAVAAYGKCYDERTDRLAASLGRTGADPLMGARGEFRDFESAIENLTAKALAASEPAADEAKSALAQLYEKQFRYEFYQGYEKKAGEASATGAKQSSHAGATTGARPGASDASRAAPSAGAEVTTTGGEGAAQVSDDPLTAAKNHFGELLDALPEDKEHQLHSAFGDMVGRSHISDATRLEIYRYAIFLLEAPGATPFSPAPF